MNPIAALLAQLFGPPPMGAPPTLGQSTGALFGELLTKRSPGLEGSLPGTGAIATLPGVGTDSSTSVSPIRDRQHRGDDPDDGRQDDDAPLDRFEMTSAQMAPMPWLKPEAVEAKAAQAPPPFEAVFQELVRRIAWSGDAHKGAVRIEFSSGALRGATLVLEQSDGRVSMNLQAPPGFDTAGWAARIRARMAQKNIELGEVNVT